MERRSRRTVKVHGNAMPMPWTSMVRHDGHMEVRDSAMAIGMDPDGAPCQTHAGLMAGRGEAHGTP